LIDDDDNDDGCGGNNNDDVYDEYKGELTESTAFFAISCFSFHITHAFVE